MRNDAQTHQTQQIPPRAPNLATSLLELSHRVVGLPRESIESSSFVSLPFKTDPILIQKHEYLVRSAPIALYNSDAATGGPCSRKCFDRGLTYKTAVHSRYRRDISLKSLDMSVGPPRCFEDCRKPHLSCTSPRGGLTLWLDGGTPFPRGSGF